MRNLPIVNAHPEGPTCVQRVPLFSGLSPAQQALIGTLARPRWFEAGETIQRAGAASGNVAVVHHGQVTLTRTTAAGRERLVRVVGPMETIGEHGFVTQGQSAYEARATKATQLCVFSYDDLKSLLTTYPDVALRFMRNLGERLVDAERQLAMSSHSVEARFADYLLDLPVERSSPEGAVVHLPLPKKSIASLLGTTPESLSRGLGRLVEKGLIIVDGDVITLTDTVTLEDLVDEA